jgi:hypothetical protein
LQLEDVANVIHYVSKNNAIVKLHGLETENRKGDMAQKESLNQNSEKK